MTWQIMPPCGARPSEGTPVQGLNIQERKRKGLVICRCQMLIAASCRSLYGLSSSLDVCQVPAQALDTRRGSTVQSAK